HPEENHPADQGGDLPAQRSRPPVDLGPTATVPTPPTASLHVPPLRNVALCPKRASTRLAAAGRPPTSTAAGRPRRPGVAAAAGRGGAPRSTSPTRTVPRWE